MSKTVRSSGNYTIKTGTGSGGSNSITLDSATTVVNGSLEVKGTQTSVDSTTLKIEDNLIIVNRNNSGPADVDGGLMVFRGASQHAALYWNEGEDVWKAVTTTSTGVSTTITDSTMARFQVGEPTTGSDAATRNFVVNQIAGGGFTIGFSGDDSSSFPVNTGNTVRIAGATNLSTVATEPDTVTISLAQNLTDITSITATGANGDLTLITNGTGDVIINDTLTFSAPASDPVAEAVTKIYNKTAGGGGTGLFFRNLNIGSGAVGELISKSKATALAIALG